MKNLKKSMLAIGLTLAVIHATEAFAAEATSQQKKGKMEIAPTIGMTSFSLKGEMDSGYKGGISVGAMSYLPSSISSLDYELGAEYLQAGGKDNYLFFSTTVELDYLSVPLGVRWKAFNYGNNSEKFFFLRVGIAPSLLISSKVKAESIFTNSQESNLETNSLDLLVYFGAGGTYPVGDNQHILYDLRIIQGTQSPTKESKNTNSGLVASVMYSFEI